jgi:hypothetical protein
MPELLDGPPGQEVMYMHLFHHSPFHLSKHATKILTRVLEGLLIVMLAVGIYEAQPSECLMQSHHGCVLK